MARHIPVFLISRLEDQSRGALFVEGSLAGIANFFLLKQFGDVKFFLNGAVVVQKVSWSVLFQNRVNFA